MSRKVIQTKATTLAFAISDAATTIRLTNLLKLDGTAIAAANIGDRLYGTFDPGTSREEIFYIDGANVTVNSDGTVDITGVVRGLQEISPYSTGGFATDHPAGAVVIFGNNPQLYDSLPFKDNDETISGDWTFTGNVTFSNFPVTPANSNASTTVKGVTKLSVAPASATDPIAAGTNDPRIPVAFAVDAVGTDAYAITPSPAITAYAAGQMFTFKAGTANTGAASLNVNGLGAITIKKNVSSDLETGDILLNQIVVCIYDGTNMQMVNPRVLLLTSYASGILPIANGGTGNANNYIKSGATTYDISTASGVQNIAHGIGAVPRMVKIRAVFTNTTDVASVADTIYTNAQASNSLFWRFDASNQAVASQTFRITSTNGGNYQEGVVTVDGTNIIITWTKTGAPAGTAQIIWEAHQ